jgi:hypothetical protein
MAAQGMLKNQLRVVWPVPGDLSNDLDLVMLCHVVLFIEWRLVPGASDLAFVFSFRDTVPPRQKRGLWRQQSLGSKMTLGCGPGAPGPTQYVHDRRTTGEDGQSKGEHR